MQSHAGDLGRFGVMWRKPVASIYIRQSRFTKTILDAQDYFTLSFPPVSYKPKESYMGSHSGRDGDKFEGSGFIPMPSAMKRWAWKKRISSWYAGRFIPMK